MFLILLGFCLKAPGFIVQIRVLVSRLQRHLRLHRPLRNRAWEYATRIRAPGSHSLSFDEEMIGFSLNCVGASNVAYDFIDEGC